MANLTKGSPPQPYGQGGRKVVLPMKATAQVYEGAMIAQIAGACCTGTTALSGNGIGIAEHDALGGATDGAIRVSIWTDKIFIMKAGVNAPLDSTPYGAPLYMEDDNSVGTGQGTEAQIAGRFMGIEDDGRVRVLMTNQASWFDAAAIGGSAGTPNFKVRAVITSLPANAGTTTGVLTASSTGAIGAQDGLTLVAGDLVFIQEGTTNLSAASDAGPYVVTNPGATGVKYVLTRPTWWETGAPIVQGQILQVGGEGTLWAGTEWKTFVAKGKVVDTDAPLFWVREVSQALALTSSAVTVTNVGVRSASKSAVFAQFQAAGGTTTSTIGYGVITAPTPGAIGTASFVIDALASGMGKNGSSDASTVVVSVINW